MIKCYCLCFAIILLVIAFYENFDTKVIFWGSFWLGFILNDMLNDFLKLYK